MDAEQYRLGWMEPPLCLEHVGCEPRVEIPGPSKINVLKEFAGVNSSRAWGGLQGVVHAGKR